jgi:hypothetical protein
LVIPNNAALQGKTLRVRITMPVSYPVTDGKIFHDETKTLTKDVSIQVATVNGMHEYWTAWGLAIGVGSFSNVAGGMALCLLGLTLRSRGQPTEMQPIEQNSKPSAPPAPRVSSSAKPALPGAIATKSTSPGVSFDALETNSPRRSGLLPYFHTKIYSSWKGGGTIYRVYVTETDFLFVHLGIGTLHPEENVHPTPIIPNAGVVVAVAISAFHKCAAMMARQHLDRLTKSLEAADEGVLREFISEDEHSFILPYRQVQNVRLEPRTFWGSLMCRDLLAFLKWSCASHGEMTLALIAAHEMVTVVEELKRNFDDVRCNISWRHL